MIDGHTVRYDTVLQPHSVRPFWDLTDDVIGIELLDPEGEVVAIVRLTDETYRSFMERMTLTMAHFRSASDA